MKALLEILKALYNIRDAIINKKNNSSEGDGDNQQNNLSWYDVFSNIYAIAPIAITEYSFSNNSSIIYLKDISIKDELPIRKEGESYDGCFLYDRNDLGKFKDGNGLAPHHPDAYKYETFINERNDNEILEGLNISEWGTEPYEITINGETFYYYATD